MDAAAQATAADAANASDDDNDGQSCGGWSVHIAKTPLLGLEALGALLGACGAFRFVLRVLQPYGADALGVRTPLCVRGASVYETRPRNRRRVPGAAGARGGARGRARRNGTWLAVRSTHTHRLSRKPSLAHTHARALHTRTHEQATAHDFVPVHAKSPLTALQLLLLGGAPGELRSRHFRGGVPRRRCFRVAPVLPALLLRGGVDAVDMDHVSSSSGAPAALDAALASFDAAWPRTLRLRRHDCRTHADALALHLTGVPHALRLDPRAMAAERR
jgi:hypothetical protein